MLRVCSGGVGVAVLDVVCCCSNHTRICNETAADCAQSEDFISLLHEIGVVEISSHLDTQHGLVPDTLLCGEMISYVNRARLH